MLVPTHSWPQLTLTLGVWYPHAQLASAQLEHTRIVLRLVADARQCGTTVAPRAPLASFPLLGGCVLLPSDPSDGAYGALTPHLLIADIWEQGCWEGFCGTGLSASAGFGKAI